MIYHDPFRGYDDHDKAYITAMLKLQRVTKE